MNSMQQQADASIGQANIVQAALEHGITLESMTPVATQTASAAQDAFNSATGSAALQAAGADAFHWVYDGFGSAAAGTSWWNTIPTPPKGPGGVGTGATLTGVTGFTGAIHQMPGTTETGNASGSVGGLIGAAVTVNVNASGVGAAAIGTATSRSVLNALRARGQI